MNPMRSPALMSARTATRKEEAIMKTFEELSQAIFLLAVEDVHPGELSRLRDAAWLNAWAIQLDPAKWEDGGLFAPTTTPRPLDDVRRQIRQCFRLSA